MCAYAAILWRGLRALTCTGLPQMESPGARARVYTDFYNHSLTTRCKTVTTGHAGATLRVLDVISYAANEIAT